MASQILTYASISNEVIRKDGIEVSRFDPLLSLDDNLKSFYKLSEAEYPKFYKMDLLSKLAYITSEVLFDKLNLEQDTYEQMGIFLSNSTASLNTDVDHQRTINDRNNYSPSPSVFVYTLPNIMMGEICIKRKIKGENTFLIFDKFDADFIFSYANQLLEVYGISDLLIGWIDVLENRYESFLTLVSNNIDLNKNWTFSKETLNNAYLNTLK